MMLAQALLLTATLATAQDAEQLVDRHYLLPGFQVAIFKVDGNEAVDIKGSGTIFDEDLATLQKYKNLRKLELRSTSVQGSGLKYLSQCTKLRVLRVYNFVTYARKRNHVPGPSPLDLGMSHLAGCKNLEKLDLQGTSISDHGLKAIGQLSSLQWLDLGQTEVTSSGIKSLRKLKNLRTLDLFDTNVGDGAGLFLGDLPSLEELRLTSTQFSDAGTAAFLDKLDRLQRLSLSGKTISNLTIRRLQRQMSLQTLFLVDTKVDDEGIKMLRPCTQLRELGLNNCNISDSALAYLGERLAMQKLYLYSGRITDTGLRHLAACKNLEELIVDAPRTTDAGWREALAPLAQLKRLDIVACRSLGRFPRPFPRLEQLRLANTTLSDGVLKSLQDCPRLSWLELDHCGLADSDMHFLKHLEFLEYLKLDDKGITDDGVALAAQAQKLTTIVLGSRTRTTDARLNTISRTRKTLSIFKLPGRN